ncbi:hypothetical protein IJG79_01135 [Candidatus Saccharibacteria bacterium]|nr:hypothetical protein [Candidatus Saccharibacteria bacterium]
MSKTNKLIAGVSALAALSALSMPLVASADTQCVDGETCSESDSFTATVNVSDMISVEFKSISEIGTKTLNCNSLNQTGTSDGCTGDAQSTYTTLLPGSSNITDNTSSAYTELRVSTNSPAGYILTLLDTDTIINLTTSGGAAINAINSKPVGTSNPGWAVSVNGAGWQIMKASNQTPITVKLNNPTASGTMTQTITNDLSTVYYGYATSSTQAPGLYTDTIIYTATTR